MMQSIRACFAVLGTKSIPAHSGSTSCRLMVGGMTPVSIAITQAMVSVMPPAPIMWPVAPLVELTKGRVSPKTVLMALVSTLSPLLVAVCRGR